MLAFIGKRNVAIAEHAAVVDGRLKDVIHTTSGVKNGWFGFVCLF